MTTREILQKTKAAWGCIRSAGAEEKRPLLLSMAESLLQHADTILYENAHDLEQARGLISEVMLDRLRLSADRLEAMASGSGTLPLFPTTREEFSRKSRVQTG